MMHFYNAQKTLRMHSLQTRKTSHMTQEQMAENLQISVRSYSDLEHGKCNFSCRTLFNYLFLLNEEEAIIIISDIISSMHQTLE